MPSLVDHLPCVPTISTATAEAASTHIISMMKELESESFVAALASHVDSLICYFLGILFTSFSLVFTVLNGCCRLLPSNNSSYNGDEGSSATEYLLEIMDDDDETDVVRDEPVPVPQKAPRRKSLLASSLSSTSLRSLRRIRESIGKENNNNNNNETIDSNTDSENNTDNDADNDEQPQISSLSASLARSIQRRRSTRSPSRLRNELTRRGSYIAERIKHTSAAERIALERIKMAQRTNSLKERVKLEYEIAMYT